MRSPFTEGIGVTVAILAALKVCELLLPASWISVIVPALLLYVPFALFWFRKQPIDFLDRSWRQFGKGIAHFWLWVLIIFPPYFLVAHFWMTHVFDFETFQPAPWQELTKNVAYQLFMVALPEEFYFRGYLQGLLKRAFNPRWKIFGVSLGWGWIVTAFLFAFAHSVIRLQWWHFSIFFPALLFGYLREKTGSITAPILFHAFSNCFMNWFAKSY